MTKGSAAYLRDFTLRLRGVYHSMSTDSDQRERCLMTLSLAITMLGEQLNRPREAEPPLQVAVIGPTQAGKSTVVNLLLGLEKAAASPLAGFTRHPGGFSRVRGSSDTQWINELLDDNEISLEPVDYTDGLELIIWDTPDFDSHRSHDYRTLIARIGALADVFVLVVSKEKYSDMSVWSSMRTLQSLGRKVIVCLNKVSSDQAILSGAVRARMSEYGWDKERTPVIVLPYTPQENAFEALLGTDEVGILRQKVFQPDNRCDPDCRRRGLRAVIEDNWEAWLQPVKAEIRAARRWQQEVDKRLQDAVAVYAEQYVDRANQNDAFNQAVLQLLELLEIPGIARPLAKARSVLTWPIRKVTRMLDDETTGDAGNNEATLLGDVVDHALLSLRLTISQHIDEPTQAGVWWNTLNQAFKDRAANLRVGFSGAVARYQTEFEPEIQGAAESLYARLQERPVVLNTLRASRVGADAAGVLVAVKTGAVGVTEALLAPAMLSLTSILTESAVGQYVDSVKDRLRVRQRALVQDLLLREVRVPLLALQNQIPNAALFRIGEAELKQAEMLKSGNWA